MCALSIMALTLSWLKACMAQDRDAPSATSARQTFGRALIEQLRTYTGGVPGSPPAALGSELRSSITTLASFQPHNQCSPSRFDQSHGLACSKWEWRQLDSNLNPNSFLISDCTGNEMTWISGTPNTWGSGEEMQWPAFDSIKNTTTTMPTKECAMDSDTKWVTDRL